MSLNLNGDYDRVEIERYIISNTYKDSDINIDRDSMVLLSEELGIDIKDLDLKDPKNDEILFLRIKGFLQKKDSQYDDKIKKLCGFKRKYINPNINYDIFDDIVRNTKGDNVKPLDLPINEMCGGISDLNTIYDFNVKGTIKKCLNDLKDLYNNIDETYDPIDVINLGYKLEILNTYVNNFEDLNSYTFRTEKICSTGDSKTCNPMETLRRIAYSIENTSKECEKLIKKIKDNSKKESLIVAKRTDEEISALESFKTKVSNIFS